MNTPKSSEAHVGDLEEQSAHLKLHGFLRIFKNAASYYLVDKTP